MASSQRYIARRQNTPERVLFDTVEDAWFWFIVAQETRLDGARFIAGMAVVPHPCEPVDILKTVQNLYRNRQLIRDHLLVLKHYGRRRIPPDDRCVKEKRAHFLWHEALERISEVLERKGIARPVMKQLFQWHREALELSVAAE